VCGLGKIPVTVIVKVPSAIKVLTSQETFLAAESIVNLESDTTTE
jgi:hypothetical protein